MKDIAGDSFLTTDACVQERSNDDGVTRTLVLRMPEEEEEEGEGRAQAVVESFREVLDEQYGCFERYCNARTALYNSASSCLAKPGSSNNDGIDNQVESDDINAAADAAVRRYREATAELQSLVSRLRRLVDLAAAETGRNSTLHSLLEAHYRRTRRVVETVMQQRGVVVHPNGVVVAPSSPTTAATTSGNNYTSDDFTTSHFVQALSSTRAFVRIAHTELSQLS